MEDIPGSLCTNRETGRPVELAWLADEAFRLASGDEPSALDPLLRKPVLDYLSSYDFTPAIRFVDKRGELGFAHILYRLDHPPHAPAHPAYGRKLKELFRPTAARFDAFRVEAAVQRLERLQGDDPSLSTFLIDLARTHQNIPFSAAARKQIQDAVLRFATRANHEKGLIYGGIITGCDPVAYGAGDLFGQMLDSQRLTSAQKREVMEFLAANTSSAQPFSRQNGKAAAVKEVADYLVSLPRDNLMSLMLTEHHQQYDQRLGEELGQLYGLPPVDVSTPGLEALIHTRDEKNLHAGVRDFQRVAGDLGFMAAVSANRQTSILSFLGADREDSAKSAASLQLQDLEHILDGLESLQRRDRLVAEATRLMAGKFSVSSDGAAFLLDTFLAHQDQARNLKTWYSTAHRILKLNPMALEARPESRRQLEQSLYPRLQRLKGSELRGWLGKEHVLDLLHPDKAAELLCRVVRDDLPRRSLAAAVKSIREKPGLDLENRFPLVDHAFQEQLAQGRHLQPSQLDTVFPSRQSSVSQQAEQFGAHLRGLSALVGLTRPRPAADQIHMIDYLMGRRADMPDFLLTDTARLDSVAPVSKVVEQARQELQRADALTRILVVNSFLAGPSSFIRDKRGMDQLVDHLLQNVRPEHLPLAHRLARALLDSQGRSDSLALAYVMGQPRGSGKSDEAAVLNSLFDAYGVPGIKFKQYLAFTSEFAEFRDAFETAQDNAMPLSYLESMRLIDKRFGSDWPSDWKIQRVLGSGSVNVAFRYTDPHTGKNEVAQVARKDIETTTEYDFYRFKRFLESLTNTPEDRKQFGYLLGLTDLIRDSVQLEFDKAAAYAMQKQVQPLYNATINGWHVGTVDAFRQDHMTIFMDEAVGTSARKLAHQDSKTYRAAMTALSQVEMNSLLGIDQHGAPHPVPLHANPDFHDGQVLIDPATHRVTLLDFGQAVPISNAERDQAVDLLRVICKAQGPRASLAILHRYAPDLKPADVSSVLEGDERMDIFIHLISALNRAGAKVPIAVAHWVMAANRQLALGEKIGVPNQQILRNLLLVKKLRGSMTTYNRLHLANQKLHRIWRALTAEGAPAQTDLTQVEG